ncbi:MAG: HEAT repeat domain-containing protein [Planctomycetota bacterium]
MNKEEESLYQLLEQAKKDAPPPKLFYEIGKLYESLDKPGDAYFFYWLARDRSYICESDLTRIIKIHPHPDLIAKAKHFNLTVRLSLIDALISIGNNSIIPILIQLLSDEVWQIRYRALTSLEAIGNYFAAEYIHQVIKDPEEVVRQHAAICLGNLHHHSSVPWLMKMLKDEDAVVRQLSIRALGNFGPNAEIIEDLKHMLHDKDAFTRKSAREILRKLQQTTDHSTRTNELPIHPF